jgi:hypothetical protein
MIGCLMTNWRKVVLYIVIAFSSEGQHFASTGLSYIEVGKVHAGLSLPVLLIEHDMTQSRNGIGNA